MEVAATLPQLSEWTLPGILLTLTSIETHFFQVFLQLVQAG